MKLKLPEIKEPETVVGLRVYHRRSAVPVITPVKIIRATDKTVWIWNGFREEKRVRASLEDSYFLPDELAKGHQYAHGLLTRYIQRTTKELAEANESMARLTRFKDRGYTFRHASNGRPVKSTRK